MEWQGAWKGEREGGWDVSCVTRQSLLPVVSQTRDGVWGDVALASTPNVLCLLPSLPNFIGSTLPVLFHWTVLSQLCWAAPGCLFSFLPTRSLHTSI